MRRTLFLAGLAACSLTACTDSTAPVVQAEDPPAFQLQWGWFGVEPGRFKNPAAIDIGPDGSIYVVDQSSRVQKFAPDGTFLTSWAVELTPSSTYTPVFTALAVSPYGVYVAESHLVSHGVYRFTTDGVFLDKWPLLTTWNGLAVDGRGLVYASTFSGLQVLTPDGELVETWPNAPTGAVAAGPGETLLILQEVHSPSEYAVIWQYRTGDGSIIRKWPIMDRPNWPQDITVAGDAVYVVLGFQFPARKYTLGGRLLSEWTETDANHEPLQTPGSVVLDAQGDLFIADYSQNRVVKFSSP